MRFLFLRSRPLLLAAVLSLSIAALPAFAASAQPAGAAPVARDYYEACGSFKFKGKHKLFKHSYACGKAQKKAKYVLKKKRAPKGWKCSLAELGNGFAACENGKKAFSFVPDNG